MFHAPSLGSWRPRFTLAVLLTSLALAGCGAGGNPEADTATTPVAAAASSPAAPTPPMSNVTPTPTPTPTPAPAPAPATSPAPSTGATGPATGSGALTPVAGQTLSLKASVEDLEAIGPFASWRTARSYGAVGDGSADDTAALQRALDELVRAGPAKVLHLQAGTYRITASLQLNATDATYGLSIIGDDPATTRIVWDGPAGAAMLIANGGLQSKFARITWDGRSRAGYGVAHWWVDSGPVHGGSPEHADEVFTDMEIGIQGGRLGAGYGNMDSEGQVRRVKFIRNSKAGVNVGSWNALNWWVWDSQFTDCARGVSNKFTVGDSLGAGSFFVYRSLFERSTVADAEIANTGTFGLYASTSIGSRRFFHSDPAGLNTAREVIQGNRVIDTTDPVAIYNGNLGPLTLIDNEFRSLAGTAGPVVRLDNLGGTDVLSVGNKFTVANPIRPTDGLYRVLSIADATVERGAIDATAPRLPATPARPAREVFEVARGASSAAIQAAIDAAVAAAARGAVNPIVHLPTGDYTVDRTLTVPANARIQIAGDSIGTSLHWAGSGTGPMLQLAGPSLATVRDLRMNGRSAKAIALANADQDGGRILMVGNVMAAIEATGLARTRLSMQANTTLASLNVSGVASALSLGSGGLGTVTLRDNSQVMVSDTWYEGRDTKLFQLESGRLTYRAAVVAPGDPVHGGGIVQPVLTLDGFRGSTTLLGVEMNIQDAGNGIRVGAATPETKALFLGMKANRPGFFAGDTSQGQVGLVMAKEPVGMGLSTLVSAATRGQSSSDFVLEMLAQARSVVWESTPQSAPSGATDVRIYRVITYDSAGGLAVAGSR